MTHEETKEKESETDSDAEAKLTGFMVESSKDKRIKKFAYSTKRGETVFMTEEQINEQKKIKRRTLAKITTCDILSRGKGPITLKVYRKDGSDETIPNFKASDLHLAEWRKVVQDFVSIDDFGDVINEMSYIVQEIFFILHQGPSKDDHARTFSSLLIAKVDKRNLNHLKQMRAIEQLRQYFSSQKVYKAGKRLLYVKMNKANLLGKDTSKVGIEVQPFSLKDCTIVLLGMRALNGSEVGQERFETYVKSKDINLWHVIDYGNKQVKDNKIDLFVQKYEEFTIFDDENIDCAFTRFNTIITSLKALDEFFSSRNHVRKFLRALPTKWCSKVTTIEESKDLSTLPLDELIGNLKVYEAVLEKDAETSKNKKEKYKSLALKSKKVSSDKEVSCFGSSDEEYAMAERDFKKFFRRKGKYVRQLHDDKKNFRRVKEEKKGKEERKCFKCGDSNHFISDCPKHSFNDQKAFVGGCWSDSEE
ncbi:zf-CCHC domain-containing protein [Tanacetum coccineum]